MRCFGAERVLPAGDYLRPMGRYEQRLPCPSPAVANVGHAYAAPELPHAGHRAWHAVRCPNGVAAWVPLAATQATAVVWTHRDGGVRVSQVSLVECDLATLTTWRPGPNGERNAWRRELPGGC